MLRRGIKKGLRYLGYEICRIKSSSEGRPREELHRSREAAHVLAIQQPTPVNPVWPLPRRSGGPSDEEIRQEFARYDQWHYAYEFEGALPVQSAIMVHYLQRTLLVLCNASSILCPI
jgi:hypothetical protein